MDVSVGIDPGYRFIGVAIIQVDVDPPKLLKAFVVDLKGTGSPRHYKEYLASRATHRRGRRTRLSRRRRERMAYRYLADRGVPEPIIRQVVRLIRHRGWRSDIPQRRAMQVLTRFHVKASAGRRGPTVTNKILDALLALDPTTPVYQQTVSMLAEHGMKPDELEAALQKRAAKLADGTGRVKRWEVEDYLRKVLPSLLGSEEIAQEVIRVGMRSAKAHGLDNRRVGLCHDPACSRRASNGIKYPLLWMVEPILAMIPRSSVEAREHFLDELRVLGVTFDSRVHYKRFRTRSGDATEAKRMVEIAWQQTVAWQARQDRQLIPPGVVEQVKKQMLDMTGHLSRDSESVRLAWCPEHLLARIRSLAAGDRVTQGVSKATMPSLTWHAVAGKLEAELRQLKTPDMRLVRVVAERDAFDALAERQGVGEQVLNRLRWLGPYGQLAPDPKEALWLETGGRCCLCGKPLERGELDKAHILPRMNVGGYPYVAIVAAHPRCNIQMGQSILRPHPDALQAMKQAIERIQRRDKVVHPWIMRKFSILTRIAAGLEDEEVVTRELRKVFAVTESTMQSTDRLIKAVEQAFDSPGVEHRQRGASEVARARMVWCSAWWDKDAEKLAGDVANHAMDAAITVLLPSPRLLGGRGGKRREAVWGVTEDDLAKVTVPWLADKDQWVEAVRRAWHPNLEDAAKASAIGITALGNNRPWRRAGVRDTAMRRTADGRYTYRWSGAALWANLRRKVEGSNRESVREKICSIRFAPLRQALLDAIDRGDQGKDALKRRIGLTLVTVLKECTRHGLADPNLPYSEHPTLVARKQRLVAWANGDDDDPTHIPPEIGVRIDDAFRKGKGFRIPGKKHGYYAIESWAAPTTVTVRGRRYRVRADGAVEGFPDEWNAELRALAALCSPKLPPSGREWRRRFHRYVAQEQGSSL